MAFDRFNDKPGREKRFDRRDSDRFSDRFSDRRAERFERRDDRRDSRFGDDRPARAEGRRFEGDRPFGDRRPFAKRPAREGFHKFGGHRNTEAAFGQISGARARALEQRRYSDHAAFAQTATVRLDPDVAKVFKDARSVNAALRAAIALGAIVKAASPAEEIRQSAPEQTPEAAAAEEPVEEPAPADGEEAASETETAPEH